MAKKKRLNIVIFFLIMIVIYIGFDFLSTIIPGFLNQSIQNSKYGMFFTGELFWLLMVIIAIYLFKSSYIFSEKKEGLIKTLIIGFPMSFYSGLVLVDSLHEMGPTTTNNIISLALYCLCIGLTEEFLIRGWILNEFLKRYGDKRKYVILSIIFSALIFGGMHITNIWYAGQTVSETILQIIFATSAGIFLGALYYRTKNIIAVAFLHGLYDFTIILGEVGDLRDCITNTTVPNLLKYQYFINGIFSIILIISGLIIIRKSKTPELNKTVEKETSFKVKGTIACIVLFGIAMVTPPRLFGVPATNNYQICYNYQEINIPYYELNTTNQDTFKFIDGDNTYTFLSVGNNIKLNITNNDNKQEIYLTDSNRVVNYRVIERDNKYLLFYIEKEPNLTATKAMYAIVDKNNITSIKESFIQYDLPFTGVLGYLKEVDNDYIYPMFKDYMNNVYIIDENNTLKLVKSNPNIPSTNKEEKTITEDNTDLKQAEELLTTVPFTNFKNINYIDAYRGTSINIDGITKEVLLSNTFNTLDKEQLELPLELSICKETNPCNGDYYVKKDLLEQKLYLLYHKDNQDITNFQNSEGDIEKSTDYYVLIKNEEIIPITKVNKIIKLNKSTEDFTIVEKVGFISNNNISKTSDVDNSIITTIDPSQAKEYLDNHLNEFISFKHIFKYDQTTNSFYYVETIVE